MQKTKLKHSEGIAMGRRFLSSGKTRASFASSEGATEAMVQYWATQARRADGSLGAAIEKTSAAFVEIVGCARPSSGGSATLEMPGARLRFDSMPPASYVAELAVEMARRALC